MASYVAPSPVVAVNQDADLRISLILREQLAAQAVAVIDAHWVRPDTNEKLAILHAATQQVEAAMQLAQQ